MLVFFCSFFAPFLNSAWILFHNHHKKYKVAEYQYNTPGRKYCFLNRQLNLNPFPQPSHEDMVDLSQNVRYQNSRIASFSTNVEFVVFQCPEARRTMMFHQVTTFKNYDRCTLLLTLYQKIDIIPPSEYNLPEDLIFHKKKHNN